jgi:peptidoglycan/LPS O-acetylase OafA/YrhL
MRFNNIQVLRFFAALGVLVFHLGHYARAQAGLSSPVLDVLACTIFAKGVFLFFVISGFVLTHNLQKSSIRGFLAFRILRIYPGFWVAVALVLGSKFLLFGACPVGKHFRSGLTLLPCGPRASYALGVEWTLIYEVFFYLVLAGLALFGRKRGILGGAVLWLAVCIVKFWLWPGHGTAFLPRWQSIFFSAFNVPFALGVCAYFCRQWGIALRPILILAVPSLLAWSYFDPASEWSVLWQSVAFAILVWYAASGVDAQSSNPLVRWGDYSYGLYLVHVPVITCVFSVALQRHWHDGSVVVFAAGTLALTLGIWYGWGELFLYKCLKTAYTWLGSRAPTVLPFPRQVSSEAGGRKSA